MEYKDEIKKLIDSIENEKLLDFLLEIGRAHV